MREVADMAPALPLVNMALCVIVSALAVAAVAETKKSEDARCKCICPQYKNVPGQFYTKKLLQKNCDCLHVINPMPVPEHDVEAYCLLCECKYEERSTVTIKVTVIIYLSVVGALLLYMGFLMVIDPLIRKQAVVTQAPITEPVPGFGYDRMGVGRAHTVLERVEGAQERWKRQVQEQRRTVFDRHHLLS
uniref:proton-transporting V-type ATPase complex assembly regulator TMEM9 isoform X1 n=1 Tax=Myxine glutinosa TaxID=7769 RepID=UPI00358FAE46